MQNISPLFVSSKDQKSMISESESSINSRTCLGHLVLFVIAFSSVSGFVSVFTYICVIVLCICVVYGCLMAAGSKNSFAQLFFSLNTLSVLPDLLPHFSFFSSKLRLISLHFSMFIICICIYNLYLYSYSYSLNTQLMLLDLLPHFAFFL